MMSRTDQNQNMLREQITDDVAYHNESSIYYRTSIEHSKMLGAHGNRNNVSGEDQSNPAEISESAEASTSSKDLVSKPKSRSSQKSHTILDHRDEDMIIPEKITAQRVPSPDICHAKKLLSNFFHRERSKETTAMPSFSAKSASLGMISAPTLIDASPNAKAILGSTPFLDDDPLRVNDAVNYSRLIATQSSNARSNASPKRRDVSDPILYSSSESSNSHKGSNRGTDNSGRMPAGPNTSSVSHSLILLLPNTDRVQIHDHFDVSVVLGDQTTDEHNTEKRAAASDDDSFYPSDYSGKEKSVKKAARMPIAFSGRAKMVDVRRLLKVNTPASSNRSGGDTASVSSPIRLTDREAEALGAQDADRYLSNAMTSQKHPTDTYVSDPFISLPYQNLLAKPANEIAAKEMARIKDAREARNKSGGLIEKFGALRVKNDPKPEVETTGVAIPISHTKTGDDLLTKMRTLKKRRKENKREIERKVKADIKRGLREESEIHTRIKVKLAAKAAASGDVHGTGIPRIDYGPPSRSTALRGGNQANEERNHARALAARRAASSVRDGIHGSRDTTTARGHLEGC